MIVPVGIALGSNLGERTAQIEAGVEFLAGLSENRHIVVSRLIETVPVGCAPGTPFFLNAVVVIQVNPVLLPARDLLQKLQAFERTRGRTAEREPNAPRPLDLDIIFFGDQIHREPGLMIPHPRAAERAFVLEPLAEIVPGFVLPGQIKTVKELLADLKTRDPSTGSG